MLPSEREPVVELTTSRTGGRSAKLVALGIAIVLGGFVYVGVSGQNSAPSRTSAAPAASFPVVAQQPSGAPALTDVPAPASFPQIPPVDATYKLDASHTLGAGLTIGASYEPAYFAEIDAKHLHAEYLVPLPVPEPFGTLELVGMGGGAGPATTYGTWRIALGTFHGNVGTDSVIGAYAPTLLVTDQRPADPAADPAGPTLMRNGFRIDVTGAEQIGNEIINVRVELGDDAAYPSETYNVVASAGRHHFSAATVESLPGHLRGEILFATSLTARRVVLELTATPAGAPRRQARVVLMHRLDLPVAKDFPGPVQPEVITAARATAGTSATGIVTNGYTLTLLTTFDGGRRAIFWDLVINPNSE